MISYVQTENNLSRTTYYDFTRAIRKHFVKDHII